VAVVVQKPAGPSIPDSSRLQLKGRPALMRAGTGGDGLRGLGDSALRRQRRRRPRRGAGSPPARSEPAAVQGLFEACREVFSIPGTVPPPAGVERIKSILGNSSRSVFFCTLGLPKLARVGRCSCSACVVFDCIAVCVHSEPSSWSVHHFV
jgi:hypothetical protein